MSDNGKVDVLDQVIGVPTDASEHRADVKDIVQEVFNDTYRTSKSILSEREIFAIAVGLAWAEKYENFRNLPAAVKDKSNLESRPRIFRQFLYDYMDLKKSKGGAARRDLRKILSAITRLEDDKEEDKSVLDKILGR